MRFRLTKKYIENLQKLILLKKEKVIIQEIDGLHPVDIADIYNEISIEDAKYLYLLLDGELAADVLAELEEDEREELLKELSNKEIATQFIDHMDSDDAADVIGDLPDAQQEEILAHVADHELAEDIADLLTYDEHSAGGLMAKELIAVNENWDIKTCLKEIGNQAEDVDEVYYVYVINDDSILSGIVSLKDLLLSNTSTRIGTICKTEILSVKPDTDAEEVANIMDKYDLVALPVIDDLGVLIGRITIDDVVDVIRDEADRDYQLLSGITDDIEPTDSVMVITRARLPWLMIGLVGGIFGARIISMYEGDLQQNAAMAFFIPLIAAMGGNVGVQSSAIVVQGLATNTIGLETTSRKILKEFLVAVLNGLTCSIIIFIYNLVFTPDFALTISVSLALLIVILFASIFGTCVPLALNRFKVDPALATGPFITTVNDILGLFIYLMISRIIFGTF